MNVRLLAARVVNQVTDGESLPDCLEPALNQLSDPRDRGFLQISKPTNAKNSEKNLLSFPGTITPFWCMTKQWKWL